LSDPARQALTVAESMAGILLQDFLAVSYPSVDRAALRQLQGRGLVYVNGMRAEGPRRLSPFDYVELRVGEDELVPHRRHDEDGAKKDAGPAVLWESKHALVIDKPAGITVVPDRSGEDAGIHGLLPELRPGEDLRVVHRLDRDTSGCLLLAKGIEAARHFDLQFRDRLVEKRYVALVHGAVARDEFTIDAFVGHDPRRPGKMLTSPRAREGYRDARTDVVVEESFSRHTLVRLSPKTGRSHQLRVHMQSQGHSIVGDVDSGGEQLLLSQLKRTYKIRAGLTERALLERMFLHARDVAFCDVDGVHAEVHAPLPGDLQHALDKVASFGAMRTRRQ
jgi:RluA family pseudouridine synthase